MELLQMVFISNCTKELICFFVELDSCSSYFNAVNTKFTRFVSYKQKYHKSKDIFITA